MMDLVRRQVSRGARRIPQVGAAPPVTQTPPDYLIYCSMDHTGE